MTKLEAKKRINRLKKLISHHRQQYHVFDKQEISDDAFDSLKHELWKLEQSFPELITADSPTQKVGGQPLKKFKKKKHKMPMLSLEDIFSMDELKSWQTYLKKQIPKEEFNYFCETKVDGFAVALIYEKGTLISGATRGDGLIGEDVTENLKTIKSIPLKLEKNFSKTLEIRGEVYMEKKDFEKINKVLDNKYSNPRNLAAGSIRQLDSKIAASRPLKFLAYDIVNSFEYKNHSEEHKALLLMGFEIDQGQVCHNLNQVFEYWQKIAKKRDSLPFQIDGIVININQNNIFDKLGITGKSPRAARAFKFSPKQATTRILDIKIQTGRTGAITPIATLEPIEIDGVTISRATLHNQDEIKRLNIKINDTVVVERAGDVIPSISRVLFELRDGHEKEFNFPKFCPNCSSKLVKPLNEAVWRCLNKKCSARKRGNLIHFVSRKAFNIEGLGPRIIDKLIDQKLIDSVVDIFSLKQGDLISLENFGLKSSENIIKSIDKSKEISLVKFIFSLAIRHLGEGTALDLSRKFKNIENFRRATKEELDSIFGIGEKTSQSIFNWLSLEKNQGIIDNLLRFGINVLALDLKENQAKKDFSHHLKEKVFVLTGSLNSMTREDAKEKIRQKGANISDTLSQKTNYLIKGQNPGSKIDKAKKLGVKIINENEFLELISKNS